MAKLNLSEQTVLRIQDYIRESALLPGEKLPTEMELAAQLGVGRNTIREALRSLATRNVVTVRQGAGCFVSDKLGVPDDPLGFGMVSDLRKLTEDLLQVRWMLEPQIASMAAQNATDEDLVLLERACVEVERDIRHGNDFARSDQAFHEALAACTHNTVVSRLVPVISEGVTTFSAAVDAPEYEQTLYSHRAIVQAVRRRAAYDARQAMEYHLLYNLNRYRGDK